MRIQLTREMVQTSKECLAVLKGMDLSWREIEIPDVEPVERQPQELRHVKVRLGLFKSLTISTQAFSHLMAGTTFLEKYGRAKLKGRRKSEIALDVLADLVELISDKRTLIVQSWLDDILIEPVGLPLMKIPGDVAMIAFMFFDVGSENNLPQAVMDGEVVEIMPPL